MRITPMLMILGCVIKFCAVAEASVLNVSPTRLFVSPNSKVESIRLKNGGDESALVEVKIFAWTNSDDGSALEPTNDFLIAPPIFEIPPETTQTLRLMPRLRDELKTERMYRIVITEVPSDVGPVNGVGFAVEMSLPVFMAPEGAEPEPEWSLKWKDVATPELTVANRGDAHVRVRSFELVDDDSGDAIFKSDDAAYVLPGQEKAWPLHEVSLGKSTDVLKLRAVTTRGPIETELPLPGS